MSTRTCNLCDAGFPLHKGDHFPTQALGMIPVTRCKKNVPRGAIKRFRELLNKQHVGPKHRHRRFQQRTRKYGDYLYAQDREKFMVNFHEWLNTQP